MTRAVGRRAAHALAPLLALTLAACDASSSSPTGRPHAHPVRGGGDSAPVRDTFTGSIISGTGSFSSAKGPVTVYLHPRGRGQSRALRLVLSGRCGGSAQGCTELNGEVKGRLTASVGGLPDTGHEHLLTGAGRVGPLGHVRLDGVVAGTGFISEGHELLKITLSSSSGSVTVVARTGPVKGFTSP